MAWGKKTKNSDSDQDAEKFINCNTDFNLRLYTWSLVYFSLAQSFPCIFVEYLLQEPEFVFHLRHPINIAVSRFLASLRIQWRGFGSDLIVNSFLHSNNSRRHKKSPNSIVASQTAKGLPQAWHHRQAKVSKVHRITACSNPKYILNQKYKNMSVKCDVKSRD